MLEGLDAIVWEDLGTMRHHAGNIPYCLPQLLNSDSAKRSEALYELWNDL